MSNLVPSHQIPAVHVNGDSASNAGAAYMAAQPARYTDSTEGEFELAQLLMLLRRHVLLISGIALIVASLAGFYVYKSKPIFRSHAFIRLLDNTKSMAGDITGTDMGDVLLGHSADPILSQLQVLESRAVAAQVVDRLGLRIQVTDGSLHHADLQGLAIIPDEQSDTLQLQMVGNAAFTLNGRAHKVQGRFGQPVKYGPATFTIPPTAPHEDATLVLLGRGVSIERTLFNLSASVRDKTDAIDVQFNSPDRALSQLVANSFVDVFREVNADAAREDSRRRRVFIEAQLKEPDTLLSKAQDALSSFRSRQQLYSSKDKFAAEQQDLMNLEVQRQDLGAQLQTYQTLYKRAKENIYVTNGDDHLRALVSAQEVAANPVVMQLYTRLVQLESVRDSMVSGRWSSAVSNPDVARVDSGIVITRSRILSTVDGYMTSLAARVAALEQLRVRNTEALRRLPASESEEMRLTQQVETIKTLAGDLQTEYQKARIAEAVEGGQVQVVDLAPVPTKPIGIGRVTKVALALILGLVLGMGAAILREHLDTAIRRREELETLLQVPGLAVIPRTVPVGKGNRVTRLLRKARSTKHGRRRKGHEGSTLMTLSDGRSSGAEAYRTLRTNLIFSQSIQSLRRIVVTSAGAAEGKTTVSANLAATFAQQGVRVLLVDCDLRRSQQHRIFEIPRDPGLSELILGSHTWEQVIHATAVPTLWLMPAGTPVPNPAEMLASKRMAGLLARASEEYDLVLFDTPPLLVAADAAVLGRETDGVLLVVRAGHTEREAARQALQQLSAVGAHVIGAVLNDPDAKLKSYGGYYYYYNSYYYEQEVPA